MRLQVGERAPQIVGEMTSGGQLTSAALVGKTVLLKFYRFADCPICNLHIREYVRRVGELNEAGVTVVCVFHSPASKLNETLRTLDIPFVVVADPDKALFDAFGVERSMRGMFYAPVWRQYAKAMRAGFFSRPVGHEGGVQTHPADFIIGPNGTVQLAHYGSDYADSLSVDAVLASDPARESAIRVSWAR